MIQQIYALILGQFVIGFSIGIFSVIVPIFINEISPVQKKGSYGVASQIAITFGILVSYIMGKLSTFYPSFNFLRIQLLFPMIPIVFQSIMLVCYYKKETPKFYILTQRYLEAKEINNLLSSNNIRENKSRFDSSLSEFRVSLYDNNFGGRTYSDLRKPIYARAFLVG